MAMSGYSGTQIQKMGRFKLVPFKEYIHEDLACYSEGMSRDMKISFDFVNIVVGANEDVLADMTNTIMVTEYNTGASAEA